MNLIGPLETQNPIDPQRFGGKIFLDRDVEIGGWVAFVCENSTDLLKHLHRDVLEVVRKIATPELVWPIAYLESIHVDEGFENLGHGTNAMQRFRRKAIERGARIAFVRIAWSSESAREKNLNFYRKTGWEFLFETNEYRVPKEAPFAFLRLRYNGTCLSSI